MRYYTQKRYEQIDPVIKHIKQIEGVFKWEDLQILGALNSQKEIKLMDEAKEAGLYSGLGVSVKNYYDEIVGMGFASSDNRMRLDQSTQQFILLVSSQFDLNFKSIAIGQKQKNKNIIDFKTCLTVKQKEVLSWIAKDKKYGEIADIMNITENTVLYHTKEIFKRLQVNSQIAAVLKAVRLGIINP